MKTRFLTVFNDMNTTGLLLENDRGVVVGRTREDPITLKAMHISKDRKTWDEVKKCYVRNAHKPQADVDFLTEDGKKVFKTAEECLSYDLMQRFGVETLDEVAQLLVSAKSALHGYGILKPSEEPPPTPDFKVAEEPILRRIEAETLTVIKDAPSPVETPAKKAKPAKPVAKVMAGETIKKAIEDLRELVSRGGLFPATVAKRLKITESSVLRIVADREDLFIIRENGKIYKA